MTEQTKPKLQSAEFSIDQSIGESAYMWLTDDGSTMVRLVLSEAKVRALLSGPLSGELFNGITVTSGTLTLSGGTCAEPEDVNPWLDKPDSAGGWLLLRPRPCGECKLVHVHDPSHSVFAAEFSGCRWQKVILPEPNLPGGV